VKRLSVARGRLERAATFHAPRATLHATIVSTISVLHLNLHREFFAAIVAKTKRIEYRDQTPYWKQRLENRHYDVIQFRNGYATKAPEMLVEFRGLRRYGVRRKAYYAIQLGRILKIRRWSSRLNVCV